MRYAVSGSNATALQEASGGCRHLLGKAITTGRILWLRSAWFYNSDAEDVICLQDSASGATLAPTSVRSRIVCACGQTTMVEFAAPGLKFTTALGALMDGTYAAVGIGIGYAGANGYEE